MEHSEKISWLRLIRSENVGPITFRSLLEHFGTAEKALRQLPDSARRGGRSKPLAICSEGQAEKEFELTEKAGAKLIFMNEPEYPALLKAIADAPPVISVLGKAALLNKPSVAIVGTRNASINGRNMARRLAADLVKAGYSIVSGLALGIDAAAHEGALYEAGDGASTIGVLGTGIDRIYPEQNRNLFFEVREKGALVSDFEFGTKPLSSNFPRRNRIISGMSLGVAVVEAALRSGSIITANKALEQGRDVFAVPANPLDPRAEGVNYLIKNGSVLVETAKDILDQLNPFTRTPLLECEPEKFFVPKKEIDFSTACTDEAREELLNMLDAAPVDIDSVTRELGLPAAVISVLLVELELAGQIERCPGNRVLRTLSL